MKTDLEKYQDELREKGITWLRGGDDTDIQIIVGDKVSHFNADGSHMDGVAATGAYAEMPRYKCHKEVWALKIAGIKHRNDQGADIVPENENYVAITVDGDYVLKHKPAVGGYYVVYEDGYKSYSPAAPFESGYTLVE